MFPGHWNPARNSRPLGGKTATLVPSLERVRNSRPWNSAVRRGREKLHYLNPVPIAEIADRWIGKFEKARVEALVALKKELEGNE